MSRMYFAWREAGYWRGHKLLSAAQISTLLHHLEYRHEVFASIQQYDEMEQVLACPIFADFDHKDATLEVTQSEVQAFVFRMIAELNVVPRIYFSGNKGFHVVLPYPIVHPHCHYIVRGIVERIGGDLKTLDKAVYRPRSMFRLPGSPASIAGYFKTQLTREELFNASVADIRRLSSIRQTRLIEECDLAKIDESAISTLIEDAHHQIAFMDEPSKTQQGLQPFLTPCLKHLLTIGAPEGSRNKAIFILSKFFKASEVDIETAREIMLRHKHLMDMDQNREASISTVLRSVYRSPRPVMMGCKRGSDAELMREFCSDMCPFSDKFPKLKFRP